MDLGATALSADVSSYSLNWPSDSSSTVNVGTTIVEENKTANSRKSRTEPSSQIDLRLLEYVSKVDRNLICPICHCPLIEPLSLHCDHSFCRHCIERTFQSQKQDTKICPTCRSPTKSTDVLPIPRFLTHLIDDLQVQCPNRSAGCETDVRRSDVQTHVEHYCEYTKVACPSANCRQTITRKDCMRECLHEIVSCGNCELQLMKGQLQNHIRQKCSRKIIQCLNCQLELIQRDLKEHEKECPKARTECKAYSIGCSFVSLRAAISKHEACCTLCALLPTIQSMQRCIKDQSVALKLLQRRNDELEAGHVALRTILGETSTSEDDLSIDFPPPPLSDVTSSSLTSLNTTHAPPFDSATHHLLSLHESLREDVDRVTTAMSNLDVRTSLLIMNENLRMKEDMAHTNAVVASMRMQLQWLTSARLQAQRNLTGTAGSSHATGQTGGLSGVTNIAAPIRRLSDSNKQELKL